jgi:hypothetical protein
MKKLLLALLLVPIGFTACHKDKPLCEGDANPMCTEELVTLRTRVTDVYGAPVMLDDYYTTRNSTGQQIRIGATIHDGEYPLLDDGFQTTLACTQETFTFRGFKNGTEVVSENYTIGADRCHVRLLKGSTQLKAR